MSGTQAARLDGGGNTPQTEKKMFRGPLNEIKFNDIQSNQYIVPSEVQILRTGAFFHQAYGKVEVTKEMLSNMVRNFNENVRRVDLAIDYRHESDNIAAGWIRELMLFDEGESLWAKVQWTKNGERVLGEKEFRYLSADFSLDYQDNESLQKFGPTLLGAGLTNRPVIKDMAPAVELKESNLAPVTPQVEAPKGDQNNTSGVNRAQYNEPKKNLSKPVRKKTGDKKAIHERIVRKELSQGIEPSFNPKGARDASRDSKAKHTKGAKMATIPQPQTPAGVPNSGPGNPAGATGTGGDRILKFDDLKGMLDQIMQRLDKLEKHEEEEGDEDEMADVASQKEHDDEVVADKDPAHLEEEEMDEAEAKPNPAMKKAQKKIQKLAAKYAEMEAKHKADKEMSEKASAFDRLLSEGRAVEAQREAFLAGDIAKFSELAMGGLNLRSIGGAAPDVVVAADVSDQVMKLAEKKIADGKALGRSVQIDEAVSMVLSENAGLRKRYEEAADQRS